MSDEVKSRHSLDGEIITIRRGLAIYKTKASPFYMLRMRDGKNKRNIVRSTKETSRIEARKVAEEFADSPKNKIEAIPQNYRFDYYADLLLREAIAQIQRKVKKSSHLTDIKHALYNEKRGLANYFGSSDIREISTKHWTAFLNKVQQEEPELSSSVLTHMRIYFSQVLKIALKYEAINSLPYIPPGSKKIKTRRTYFRFHPIVSHEQDEYEKLKRLSKKLAKENIKVRGVPITEELYDIIVFTVNSFVRPTYNELCGLRHKDVSILENKKALYLTLYGKTGFRNTTSMEVAVGIYEKICKRNPNHKPDDYIFLPQYKNRKTAIAIIQRQFDYLLKKAELKYHFESNKKHSMYSLRHTALMMRLVKSEGESNTYFIAKNAGTSLEMLNLHYLPEVPPTEAMIKNLQSFGKKKKKLSKKEQI